MTLPRPNSTKQSLGDDTSAVTRGFREVARAGDLDVVVPNPWSLLQRVPQRFGWEVRRDRCL